jgi:hypothetical protein
VRVWPGGGGGGVDTAECLTRNSVAHTTVQLKKQGAHARTHARSIDRSNAHVHTRAGARTSARARTHTCARVRLVGARHKPARAQRHAHAHAHTHTPRRRSVGSPAALDALQARLGVPAASTADADALVRACRLVSGRAARVAACAVAAIVRHLAAGEAAAAAAAGDGGGEEYVVAVDGSVYRCAAAARGRAGGVCMSRLRWRTRLAVITSRFVCARALASV